MDSFPLWLTTPPEAFPTLDEAGIAAFDALGTRRTIAVGDYLYLSATRRRASRRVRRPGRVPRGHRLEAREGGSAPVVIVGGGNSAGQAALYLSETGSPITIVIRGSDLARSMSRYLVDRIEANPRIEVRTDTIIAVLGGDTSLSALRLASPAGEEVVKCAALFSFIGAEPASEWLSGCAALDERGFVLTDRSLEPEHLGERWGALGRRPLPYETSQPGLFAVHEYFAFGH